MKHDDDRDPGEETMEDADPERKPVDPEDAEEVGFVGGSGGPASIIYGEDDEADEHGDQLTRGPDESR
ncbi:MAG: hypothetical protein H0V68_07570 [Actinobacteria bacterium]|nr:hypothetical protein [Actinomycetota bacterium]